MIASFGKSDEHELLLLALVATSILSFSWLSSSSFFERKKNIFRLLLAQNAAARDVFVAFCALREFFCAIEYLVCEGFFPF
jgi:hypothetical protein